MSLVTRFLHNNNRILFYLPKNKFCTQINTADEDNFKPLNLKHVRGQTHPKRRMKKAENLTVRANQMPVDQDWGNVWMGPRTFHPAVVPLPLHQGYAEKGAPPNKFANAELMKIPNFLHLTPPVIKRQCEALKQFCTPWPQGLETDEKCGRHFPIEIVTSDYCHSSPTIRDPLSRIVTVQIRLSQLELDKHAKDKFLRLIGDRYNEDTDIVTIVTDRCPTRKQNLEYAMYLLTAVYHESWITEKWESDKSEVDMEYYDWDKCASRKTVEKLFAWTKEDQTKTIDAQSINNITDYKDAVNSLCNEGENDYTINKYSESVRKILNIPVTS